MATADITTDTDFDLYPQFVHNERFKTICKVIDFARSDSAGTSLGSADTHDIIALVTGEAWGDIDIRVLTDTVGGTSVQWQITTTGTGAASTTLTGAVTTANLTAGDSIRLNPRLVVTATGGDPEDFWVDGVNCTGSKLSIVNVGTYTAGKIAVLAEIENVQTLDDQA